MKHIVQFSGGAGSAMAAYLVAQKVPKEDIVLLFHDVRGGHDEDMYRFNADVSEFLGIPITEYSSTKTMWDIVKSHNVTPSLWMPFCTHELKLEMGDRFCEQLPYFAYHQDNPGADELALYPYVEFILYTGFCLGEGKRLEKAEKFKKVHPVFDAGLNSDDCKRVISEE